MNPSIPRVLCAADLEVSPATRDLLRESVELLEIAPDRDQLLRSIPGCDGYIASLHVQFDRAAFERADRLRVIATSSTGTDHIDLDEARLRNVEVLTLRDETDFLSTIPSTAELAWGLLLAAARRIPWGHADVLEGRWGRDRFRGRQLAGLTCGILGFGRLGRIVAEYARAFRMRVIACDMRDFEAPGVEPVSFDELLEQSDVISVHVHLTPDNRQLISREGFRRMKPGVVLINTSRGAVIDEEALVEALESGQVSAAGLDVIVGEWENDLSDHPLVRYAREHDNLVITPHLGGTTREAQDATLQFIARKLIDRLVGTPDVQS